MAWEGKWKPYVPVGQRLEAAARHVKELKRGGLDAQPVSVAGRKIARSFWGAAWCSHLESFSDMANRLPRGRTYVRNGSVCHLEIGSGIVKAIISGSSLYRAEVAVHQLPSPKWSALKEQCSNQISSLLDLLQGKLSPAVLEIVTHRSGGLFPLPAEIKMKCDCPDYAYMCKHLAAVLYGVGARLDEKPELLFLLRGVNHEELIESNAASLIGAGKRANSRRMDESDIADIFGIDILGGATSEASPVVPESSSPAPLEGFMGRNVRELRAKLEMSPEQLAIVVGVSVASIRKWEKCRGQLRLKPKTSAALSAAMRLTKKKAWKLLLSR